jgi:hypothetical protein
MDFLTALGHDVEIRVKRTRKPHGKVSVIVAARATLYHAGRPAAVGPRKVLNGLSWRREETARP